MSLDEARLFEGHIQSIVAGIMPLVTSLSWIKKQKVSAVLDFCTIEIERISSLLSQYVAFNRHLFNTVDIMKDYLLYQKQDDALYVGDEFIKDVVRQRTSIITKLRNNFGKIENELHNMYEKVVDCDSSTLSKSMWLAYAESVDCVFLKCQKNVFQNSMLYLEKMLTSSRAIPEYQIIPLFQLKIVLSSGKITSCPLLDHLWQSLSHLKDILLDGFRKVPCLLRRYDLQKSKAHDHIKHLDDESSERIQLKITSNFDDKINELYHKLKSWEKYCDVWELSNTAFLNHYTQMNPTIDQVKCDVRCFSMKIEEVQHNDNYMNVGAFHVDFRELKENIVIRYKSWIETILEHQYHSSLEWVKKIDNTDREVHALEDDKSKTIEELLHSFESCKRLFIEIKQGEQTLDRISLNISVLKEFDYNIPKGEENALEKLRKSRNSVLAKVECKMRQVQTDLNIFKKKLTIDSEELKIQIKQFTINFHGQLPIDTSYTPDNAFDVINDLENNLQEISQKLVINEQLSLVSLPLVDFSEEKNHFDDLSLLQCLWNLIRRWNDEWNKWKSFSVWDVSIISFKETLSLFSNNLKELPCSSNDDSETGQEPLWEIHEDILARIDSAKKILPLLEHLQEASLQRHHWDEIRLLIMEDFEERSESFNLEFLHNSNLTSYTNEVSEIVLRASMEHIVINEIEKVKTSASTISLNFSKVSVIGIFVIQSVNEAFTLVSELLMKLRFIRGLDYANLYQDKIESAENDLRKSINIIEQVGAIQTMWNKWAPFFYSNDVRINYPDAVSFFEECNSKWKVLSDKMNAMPQLISMGYMKDIEQSLDSVKALFEKIHASVADFFQDARHFSPRFNFLSDHDIVTLTSTIIDSESTRYFIPKLFTSLSHIKVIKNVSDGNAEISAVVSKEMETVDLINKVPLNGPFHSSINALQVSISNTLKEQLKHSRVSLRSVNHKIDELLKAYPLQVCILALHLALFSELQKSKAKTQGGHDALISQEKYLRDISFRCNRVLMGSTSQLLRDKIQAFYVTILFLRDELNKIKCSKGEKFHMSDLALTYNISKESGQLVVNLLNHQFPYGWDYLGMKSHPIVCTDSIPVLTNILKAFSYNEIPIANGEHLTGKKETFKLLAYLLGSNNLIVKCNSFMSAKYFAQLLVSCIQLPSFLTLDKSEDISPEVLSSVYDMLDEIMKIKDSVSNSTKVPSIIQFQGLPVVFNENFRMGLITTGINYKSRNVIESLRWLCRPVPFFRLPREVS